MWKAAQRDSQGGRNIEICRPVEVWSLFLKHNRLSRRIETHFKGAMNVPIFAIPLLLMMNSEFPSYHLRCDVQFWGVSALERHINGR